jgi:asparagine synthase (glutamine-hydrolysing)
MCGIAGYCGESRETEKLQKMTEAISRRGPDDFGYHESTGIGFGFRRLSIIDLSSGHQPMSNEDETIWVMLNGEIYDFQKIREELISLGHKFRTESDTEIIIHGYEQWREDVFKKIDGMFAIAIWDYKQSKLILARDRMGKKPLYWTVQNETLWFASELKAFINANVFEKEIDNESIYQYFRLDYIPTPKTIFKDVWKLEPATFLSYKNNTVTKTKFWSPEKVNLENLTEEEALEKLKKEIDIAVKKRLVSDVPVGLFLSGGLDSTIIAESASRQKSGLEAFTLGFEDSSYDETINARKIAKAFNLKHQVEIMKETNALEMLEEAVSVLDEPLADPSILPQLLISKFTKQDVTVCLSGDGGDELLLGYQHIKAHLLLEKFSFLNKKILNLFGRILSFIPSNSKYFSFGFVAQRLSRGIDTSDRLERDILWRGAFKSEDIDKLLNKQILEKVNINSPFQIMKEYENEYSKKRTWSGWSFSYIRTFLMDCVMVKVDRATMWYGLESRAPLLDSKVVSLILNLPDKYKLGKYKNKGLFKKILKDKVPDEILNIPKHGFGMPVSKWLNENLSKKLLEVSEESFLNKQSIFKREFILKMIDEHKKGTDRRKELWAYLVFQLWYIKWIEK